ncbi:flagellar biosynthesis anti-sigma factor FlgM [Halorhodospira halophila]|uniref:Negative regulator of flagellin synthesis n=1 Tax=Halorhodospira halophila (strain DSM 244 / SL1) TaxID=349124 RepID=A1WUE9_HALHL|nr:flagellar biosynthesis anti-sigma factor FlgM [Halorhodospira halophila]ABM61311.1 anti-sigma-28 factor, FlgM [Halorhodospira halophila SL1]
MSNPIEGGGPRPVGPATAQPGKGQKSGGADEAPNAPSKGAAGGADEAATSERLQTVRERIDQTPEVDRDRVEAIKERIANGDYPVDAEKVAKKFAELEALVES